MRANDGSIHLKDSKKSGHFDFNFTPTTLRGGKKKKKSLVYHDLFFSEHAKNK